MVLAIAAGCLLGLVSGMVPGIHVNTLAAMLVSLSALITTQYDVLAIVVLCAAVVHSFVSIVPSMLLGAPDPDTALAVLPGHRLLLEGRGIEAIMLSALGSLCSAVLGIALAPAFVLFLLMGYPALLDHMGLLLLGVMVVMVVSERPSTGSALAAVVKATCILVLSGVLGVLALKGGEVMYTQADAVLMPLLTGLFGAPLLIESVLTPPPSIPPQTSAAEGIEGRRTLRGVLTGTAAGALVSWMPGVSASVGTLLTRLLLSRGELNRMDDAREYMVSISGVNTSDVVFSLLTLYVAHRSRSGAMVAIEQLFPPTMWSPPYVVALMLSLMVASLVGYTDTIRLGAMLLRTLYRIRLRTLTLGTLAFLLMLVAVLTGAFGIVVFLSAIPVGLLCGTLGVRRSNTMGVLLIPATLYFL